MTSMPQKLGLRYFYFNSNGVVTLCMQNIYIYIYIYTPTNLTMQKIEKRMRYP